MMKMNAHRAKPLILINYGKTVKMKLLYSPAVPPKSFGGEAQAGGQKGRGLGGRNFCPPTSVPVPFEQEKSGRGVWGEFRPPSPASSVRIFLNRHRQFSKFGYKKKEVKIC